jgi:hypothetical protein
MEVLTVPHCKEVMVQVVAVPVVAAIGVVVVAEVRVTAAKVAAVEVATITLQQCRTLHFIQEQTPHQATVVMLTNQQT